jgi:hypothetical protein
MEPPNDEIRREVARRAFEIAEAEDDQGVAEEELAELLDWVWEQVEQLSRAAGFDQDDESLAVAESWLSVASYPVAVFYAPQSPFKKWNTGTLAGIAPSVTNRLARIVSTLRPHLVNMANRTSVDEAGVSFQFPWGVGAGVAWDVSQSRDFPRIMSTKYPHLTGAGHEFVVEVDSQTRVTATSPD